MNIFHRKLFRGFTIIELMIVLIIVAILLALAYPSYIQYVRKAKRGEAQQLLLNWAINQEIFRSNNATYADGDALPPPTHENYTFTVTDVTATSYTVQAEAQGDQVNDKAKSGDYCGKTGSLLSLDENGVKSPAACWE